MREASFRTDHDQNTAGAGEQRRQPLAQRFVGGQFPREQNGIVLAKIARISASNDGTVAWIVENADAPALLPRPSSRAAAIARV